MVLTKSQIKELKSQLEQQISHLPTEKQKEAQEQIDSLSPESLETMLEQQHSQETQKIFRMIIEGKIPSVKIDENEKAIAVLSVKSISKGHTLIIPKSQITNEKDIPKEAHALSEKLSKKLISSLKASSTSLIPESSFGEMIINVIPIYDKPLSLKSPREDISIEKLEEIKKEINVEKIEKTVEKIKIEKAKSQILKLKRRIP